MTWSFMSVSDVEVTVTRLLSAASFGDASLPAPLLELRATCAFYIAVSRGTNETKSTIDSSSRSGDPMTERSSLSLVRF